MTDRSFQPGVYLNPREGRAVRLTVPYWLPPPSDWVFLTPEVSVTLVRVRELVRERGLYPQPEEIVWAAIPQHP